MHVLVLNSTAAEVKWNLPLYRLRNGIIRGFKVFVQAGEAEERKIDVADGDAEEYIVSGLQPGTAYTFSVLAYTVVGDGPRSIHLTLSTFSQGMSVA